MTVLITRPLGDCESTVAALAARGISAIAAPVLEVRFRADVELPRDCRALLITSANALRAIAGRAELEAMLDIPVYAVGNRTADKARRLGFGQVRSAGGNVDDLARLVRTEVEPGGGTLVHLSGRDTAGDIAGALADGGYETERLVVYETMPAASLPTEAIEALKAGRIEAVLLYSPRSARAFATLASQAGLDGRLASVTAAAISQNTARAAADAGFGHISVADTPEESALFDTLARLLDK